MADKINNESYRKKYNEQPKLEHLSEETLKNPPKQRTVQQQEKQDRLIKKEKREAGLESNRSRSSSRRERRKRIQQAMTDGKYMKTGSLEALEEADANGDLDQQRPFERIGPDSTSMDGPVTHARAMRGEIPVRGSNPNQPYYITPQEEESNGSALKDTDGLKLTLEANLDVEIELKASIRGDLTLSLYA
ncbi:hypothetical protein CB0940_00117 [Cercospora beticola]|uniref:Uncharacterized protein n=1 Tax=Cercospora beticola TaxID=122368 RepID=A0A2G5IBZ7_CERBT|nr:hypothetical protein CB0940_00117 [Cercospora beticola]PIB02291.1 hypothetical protein CB0940_00117 [Cercospora beticola]WPA95520.1 hypothetical protein RHO25_000121 [Cercospora beticola]CAK1356259.1 unnamed protein product [Cercospora beticola]